MIPRLDIQFPLRCQWQYWFGKKYEPQEGEYLLNHARAGIVMALQAALPNGGRVGVVAYNCHTVANAVVNAECTPVFVDVTEDLKVDIDSVPTDLDAIVVTNLFGIRNDIEVIRKRCPEAVIIVDNAHGYGLPTEGDFTVYSINQGKFPALGEGGILIANKGLNESMNERVTAIYQALPTYGFISQLKLFCSMQIKAVAYSKLCYWLTMRLKKSSYPQVHQQVLMRKMAPGIRRLYSAWLPYAEEAIVTQCANAEAISKLQYPIYNPKFIWGNNAFMAIVRTEDPKVMKAWFAEQGIETETHFKNAITWAKQFGYIEGSCPKAEILTKQLLMIPTYRKI